MYDRNNRQRGLDTIASKQTINVAMDILDSIHCYFIHSVDTGSRIIHHKEEIKTSNNEEEHDDELNNHFDAELNNLRAKLSAIRENNGRTMNRVKNNKFVTQITNKSM